MATRNERIYSDLPIPPGEILQEELDEVGMTQKELEKLIPENYELPAQPTPKAKPAEPVWTKRYKAALANKKRWLSKEKRAKNALKKINQKVRYYERTYSLRADQ